MQVLGAPFSEAEQLESKFYPAASVYLVKFTLEQAAKALDGGGLSTPRPGALPHGKSRYPLYRRLGGPQARCGRVWKISVAQLVEALRYKSEGRGFDSRWCH
jgi:hypothetical protein